MSTLTKQTNEFEDNDWKIRYKEYIDKKYLELSNLSLNQSVSKLELLTLGATKYIVKDYEFLVVKLPFHLDNPLIFYEDLEGIFYKW